MKLANKIQKELIKWCPAQAYDIIIPNFYHGIYEMDVFKLMHSGYVVEYEIKISKSDFKADFKKGNKHSLMEDKKCMCNRFYFVVPEGLININEVPKYAGLIYFTKNEFFHIIKTAPLIHKQMNVNYKSLCHSMSFRERNIRGKLNYMEFSHERDLIKLKNELKYLKELTPLSL